MAKNVSEGRTGDNFQNFFGGEDPQTLLQLNCDSAYTYRINFSWDVEGSIILIWLFGT